VVIIGVGLIGSSFARAARAAGIVDIIVGYDPSAEALATALQLGVLDEAISDLDEALRGADIILIAAPVGAYAALGPAIKENVKPGAIITDVGSVKGDVIDTLAPFLPDGVDFVPGHPVAGTELSGPAAGFAEMFRDRWCILTPPPGANPDAIEKIASAWRALGSDVEIMEASHHDRVLAMTSHLPHLIAYAIVATANDLENQLLDDVPDGEQGDTVTTREVIKFSAGGFRDFTRIAGSNPIMWRDVFLTNKDAVLEMLGRFSEDLTALQRAIRWADADALEDMFTRTREIRRGVVDAGQAGRFVPTENGESKDGS
jgi:cyclohexadieny/prephenate dehydrogenase